MSAKSVLEEVLNFKKSINDMSREELIKLVAVLKVQNISLRESITFYSKHPEMVPAAIEIGEKHDSNA